MNTLSQELRAEIKRECEYLTRRQWRVAMYVILFIVGSGMFFRQVYVNAVAAKVRANNVHSSQ